MAVGFHDPDWDMSAGTEYPVRLALRRSKETLYEWDETGLVVADAGPDKEMLLVRVSAQDGLDKFIQLMREESDSLHLSVPDTGEVAFVVDLSNAKTAWWNLLKCNDVANGASPVPSAKHPFSPVKQ